MVIAADAAARLLAGTVGGAAARRVVVGVRRAAGLPRLLPGWLLELPGPTPHLEGSMNSRHLRKRAWSSGRCTALVTSPWCVFRAVAFFANHLEQAEAVVSDVFGCRGGSGLHALTFANLCGAAIVQAKADAWWLKVATTLTLTPVSDPSGGTMCVGDNGSSVLSVIRRH